MRICYFFARFAHQPNDGTTCYCLKTLDLPILSMLRVIARASSASPPRAADTMAALVVEPRPPHKKTEIKTVQSISTAPPRGTEVWKSSGKGRGTTNQRMEG